MSKYLSNPEDHMSPSQLKRFKEDEAKQLETKRLQELQAKERKAERALIRNCDHTFEDVTEERRKLIEERGLPDRVKRLIAKKDPPDRIWGRIRELWKEDLKYEKCTAGCGLLKVSMIAPAT